MKNKNIQIIYIITKLELGGAQKVCLSLFEGMQKNGCSSFLLSGTEGLLASQFKEHKKVIFVPTMKREVSLSALFAEIKNFFALVRSLKKIKKDNPHLMVHTHSTKAGLVGRWAAWWAGIKTRVHTVHGYGFHEHQSWFAWLPIYFLELITSFITTHFICVSAHDVKTGSRLFPYFSNKHSIIRAGVDHKQFYVPAQKISKAFTQNTFTFGTISCFKPQKNLFDLLKAFETAYLQNTRARLEIIGDGIQRPEIEAWIAEHDLSSVITLHSWQKNITAITQKWNAFVLSSLWEGLPCAIIEARLQHLPVISYKTGGIPEVIFDKKNGLLFEQKNWPGLAHGMIQIMHNNHLYNSLQSYRDDFSEFDTNHMITEHIKLYKKLLT